MDLNTLTIMNNAFAEKPVLVTGSGGGLGKAIIKALRVAGYKNILMPSREELDLLDRNAVHDYFSANRPVAVLHLASVVFGLQGNIDNQLRSLSENTLINLNVFSAIENYPVEYVFFAGTVAAYSFPYINIPLVEGDFFSGLPHGGEFGYAMSKRHAYAYLHLLAETKKIRFNYGVFTNLYGENDRFNESTGHVIPSLVMKAHAAKLEGKPFYIWGDGSAERDFLHFDDAAAAVLLCMNESRLPPLVNISSGVSVTIRQLAMSIANESGCTDVRFQSEKPVGIKSRVVANDRLKEFGFTQSVDLGEGIRRLCQWYSTNSKGVRV